ncbi:MAG: flagellar basal body-associated FliL family protein [Thermodesulfobacteriota bacterium]
MAEEPRPDPSVPAPGGHPAAEHSETDWGADWESAFQAEDDAFFASADEEFFIEEEPAKEAKPGADAALEKALADTQPATAETTGKPLPASLSLAPLLGLFARLTTLPARLLSLPRSLWQRFTALPVRGQIIVVALALAVPLTSTMALWLLLPPTSQVVPAPPPPPALSEEAKAVLSQVPSVPDKIRKKLTLNGFLIPVRDGKESGPLLFAQIDLTLNTLLGEEEELPPDKESMVRDIIYQFFANRTLDELRRYQLARGELQRDLRAWLAKQWPDAPVESITFSRYQLG